MNEKEKLRCMLDHLIDGNAEQAQADFHQYLQSRMKDRYKASDAERSE